MSPKRWAETPTDKPIPIMKTVFKRWRTLVFAAGEEYRKFWIR